MKSSPGWAMSDMSHTLVTPFSASRAKKPR